MSARTGDSTKTAITNTNGNIYKIYGDLPCMQLASYLEWSPLIWMMLQHLHVNLNAAAADDDDDEVGGIKTTHSKFLKEK